MPYVGDGCFTLFYEEEEENTQREVEGEFIKRDRLLATMTIVSSLLEDSSDGLRSQGS